MPPTANRRAPQRRSGGGFWLALVIIAGGIGAVYVFAPDVPRRLLGSAPTPPPGDEPVIAQSTDSTLATRDTSTSTALQAPSGVVRTANTPAVKQPTQAPVAAPIKSTYDDEAKASELLVQAEKAYVEAPGLHNWNKSTSLARQIASMDVTPATKVRAQDILKGSIAMEKLFNDLDDRDELSRNFETNPNLVLLVDGPNPSQAVPIRSMDDQSVVDGDPVVWLTNQRRTGKVTVLLRGRKDFVPASIPSDRLGKIEKADVDAIVAERRSEFNSRLTRLKNSDLANNPLAWYDAAKFAYQNRLDDQVATMMDKALILDPLLAASVREDKAASLFSYVVLHLNNNNTKQASAFMAILDKRFGETPSGREARAFYDLKTKQGAAELAAAQEALRQVREDARLKAKEVDAQRRQERIDRAKQLGDPDAIKAAESAPKEDDSMALGAPISGDEAKADDLFAQGKDYYQKALEAGNNSNRDELYHNAQKYLTQAQNLYNQLLDKNANPTLEEKAFMCNKLRYGSIKQQRFH